MYIETINSTESLKKLSVDKLNVLSREMGEAILKRASKIGGHLASDLGIIDIIIALHYVFESPKDKIVFDVSHQAYPHKMLTGRMQAYIDDKHFKDVTGFTNILESEHDIFTVGHTSTSLSLASGLAKGRDLKGDFSNVIAIIGDGSLSGGQAFEALDNIGDYDKNLIIIVNDNEMSIAENHGGLYRNLRKLRQSKGKYENNYFKTLGLEYRFVEDGHNIEGLIDLFKEVKDIDHPIVLHIATIKGRGYEYAELDSEKFHSLQSPFDIETGEVKKSKIKYSDIIADYLIEKTKEDSELVIVTSGVPNVLGLSKDKRDQIPKGQYIDVGIAEEHAVGFISGIARNGAKPVYGTSSTFIQRTYDQLSQDLMMNNNPATILIYNGSMSSGGNMTHLGIYDIPLMSHIPNLVYLAPTSDKEHLAMLKWAINQKEHPVAIRVVPGAREYSDKEDTTDYSILNKYKVIEEGSEVAIIALGSFFERGKKVSNILKERFNIKATLINPVYITGLDKELLISLKDKHRLVITLEDGAVDGGFGQGISGFLGIYNVMVKNYGVKKEFPVDASFESILKDNGLRVEDIVKDVVEILNESTINRL